MFYELFLLQVIQASRIRFLFIPSSSIDFACDITSTTTSVFAYARQSVCFLFIPNSSVDFVCDITSTSPLSSTSSRQSVCFLFIPNSSVDFACDIASTSPHSSVCFLYFISHQTMFFRENNLLLMGHLTVLFEPSLLGLF